MAPDPTDPTDAGDSTERTTVETPDGRTVTTDREAIREWAEGRDAVPVTVLGGEAAHPEYTFVRRSDLGEEHEERSWDEFFETFGERDMAFVYGEETTDDLGEFELTERTALAERGDLESAQVEALRAGETVTTERVETRVVEREVVETDTIESEVVETTVLERDVVASEVLERDVIDVSFVEEPADEPTTESAEPTTEPAEPTTDTDAVGPDATHPALEVVAVTVDERRADTVEELEQLTIESRVVDVDVDVDEREALDVDQLETSIGDETIHRAILENDVLGGDQPSGETDSTGTSATDVSDVLERDVIHTTREGNAFESRLLERRTREEDVRDRRRLRYRLEDAEILETEATGGEVVDAELLDVEEFGEVAAREQPAAGAQTSAETDATAESSAMADEPPESAVTSESATEPAGTTGAAGPSVELTPDEQGKAVVDETGDRVGIVANVETDRVYVDPEPGLVDRLRARFDWGGPDRDAYPVARDQIREVTDEEVVLRGQ